MGLTMMANLLLYVYGLHFEGSSLLPAAESLLLLFMAP